MTTEGTKAQFIVEVKNTLEKIAKASEFSSHALFENCNVIGRLIPNSENEHSSEIDVVLLDTTNHNGAILMPTMIEEGRYIFEFCLITDNACYEWYHNIFFTSPESE